MGIGGVDLKDRHELVGGRRRSLGLCVGDPIVRCSGEALRLQELGQVDAVVPLVELPRGQRRLGSFRRSRDHAHTRSGYPLVRHAFVGDLAPTVATVPGDDPITRLPDEVTLTRDEVGAMRTLKTFSY